MIEQRLDRRFDGNAKRAVAETVEGLEWSIADFHWCATHILS
jgi:hypothetical protein